MPRKRGHIKRGRHLHHKRKDTGFFSGIRAFAKNEKLHQTIGFCLLLFSAFMLISFTSYIFTWQNDQDKISVSWGEYMMNPDIRVENWLGKLGALLSHIFLYKWFGISSFIFILLFFILSIRILFGTNLLPIKSTFSYALFTLIWLPVLFGHIFHESDLLWFGGNFGYTINIWLNSAIGEIGTSLLLAFALIIFFVFTINFSIKKIFVLIKQIISKYSPFSASTETDSTGIEQALDFDPQDEPSTQISLPTEKEIEEEIERLDHSDEEQESVLPLKPETEKQEEGVSFETIQGDDASLDEKEINRAVEEYGEFDPTLELGNYELPPINLLTDYGGGIVNIDRKELEANKDRIVNTLGDYNIEIQKIKATIGPSVTLYEIIPSRGTRISKIKNLEDDIALSLSALGIRIIAPIPGKGTIGIEVPNNKPEIVGMRSMITSEKYQNSNMELPIALGKTIANETYISDLTKMPHLLVAGATGQGKSVGLNDIIVSLLYKKHPAQVKFVMVDPKKVELTLFKKLERHFLAKLPDAAEAIITENQQVVHTLNSLCTEMEQRLLLLNQAGVRNIKEYNNKFIHRKLNPNKGHRYLPYIVLIIDEFADLIMMCGKEVEGPITRLAQLARAIGIHLIIATQRPSTNIITGTIKANFPTRIAFRVISQIDSRTILDSGGAEQLVGRGDMLLSTGSELVRLQCAFIDTSEVERITDYIGNQRGYPDAFHLPEYVDEKVNNSLGEESDERDQLFYEAAEIVVQHQQGSASLLQRRLRLGYNRAGRIIDQLESAGIIGPFEGSKARQVLIPDLNALEQFLNPPDTSDNV